ncbi:Rieske 2Fe-2S domain-containing protein [Rhodobacteraceae bacterium M382]|nr:Rieske 2Fe-2S domain-containing protein [Rhodobacteraceae bacterium M382]
MDQIRQDLQQITALPADRPMTMPGAFYTDPEYFELEIQTVLKHGWHCLGRTDEVPEPGDYFTIQLFNEPLIVVRGDDMQVRVLANVCRHRGMPLAEGRGKVKRFVCSYHAWAYGRDGSLLRAARMENAGFDAKSCRLHGFNTVIWQGFVYINLDDQAAPFTDNTEALDAQLVNYEADDFRVVHVEEGIWKTNWKCLVENFMEGYHLSVVHPQTLHGYTPTGLARKSVSGPGFTSYCANYPEGIESRGLGGPNLTEAERNRSTLYAIFPTQVTSQAASLLVSISIFPLSADEIRVKWTMSVRGDDLDEDTIQQRIALWTEVNREDREKLERMQVALKSSHAESGPLAGDDLEGTIRDFQMWLAREDTTQLQAAE